jgi:hypothetical protein
MLFVSQPILGPRSQSRTFWKALIHAIPKRSSLIEGRDWILVIFLWDSFRYQSLVFEMYVAANLLCVTLRTLSHASAVANHPSTHPQWSRHHPASLSLTKWLCFNIYLYSTMK